MGRRTDTRRTRRWITVGSETFSAVDTQVIEGLERIRRKRGRRPCATAAQSFYVDASASDAWTSAVRPFDVIHADARIDVALLRLRKSVDMPPVKLAADDYTPIVGEGIGLCGYAHGSMLTMKGERIDRVGPLVQTGVIAAVSSFDVESPTRSCSTL